MKNSVIIIILLDVEVRNGNAKMVNVFRKLTFVMGQMNMN